MDGLNWGINGLHVCKTQRSVAKVIDTPGGGRERAPSLSWSDYSNIRFSASQPSYSQETVLATGTLASLHLECGLQLGCSLPRPLEISFPYSLMEL